MDLPGHVLAAGRAHAVGEAELPALLGDPHGTLGALGDIRHAVAQRGVARLVKRSGKPAKVQVAIGGDALVVHTSSRVGGGHARPGRPSRPGAGSVGIIRDRCQTKAGTGSICFARSTQPSPRGRAAQLELPRCERPGSPQRGSLTLARVSISARLASAALAQPRTPRAARALAPRLARNLPQCQGQIDPLRPWLPPGSAWPSPA